MDTAHQTEQPLRAIMQAIEEALAGEVDLHTIILYGSAAHNVLNSNHELRSDVDLAVAAPGPISVERMLSLIRIVSMATGREADLVDLRAARGLLLKNILTRGRILRNQDPEFVAEKAQELYDHEVFFAPVLRAARRHRVARFTRGDSHGS